MLELVEDINLRVSEGELCDGEVVQSHPGLLLQPQPEATLGDRAADLFVEEYKKGKGKVGKWEHFWNLKDPEWRTRHNWRKFL